MEKKTTASSGSAKETAERPVTEAVEKAVKAAEEVPEVKETAEKAAKKASEKIETVKDTAKKAEKKVAAKAETVKETAKKVIEKADPKKTVTKKADKKEEMKPEVFVQFQNQEASIADIVEKAKRQFEADGHRVSSVKSLRLYLKPEESAAYYVINEKYAGRVDLF